MCEKVGLFDACVVPQGFEPRDALLPVIQDVEGGEIGIGFDDVKDGILGFCEEIAEALCEFAS
jgi:hypothetical protein